MRTQVLRRLVKLAARKAIADPDEEGWEGMSAVDCRCDTDEEEERRSSDDESDGSVEEDDDETEFAGDEAEA